MSETKFKKGDTVLHVDNNWECEVLFNKTYKLTNMKVVVCLVNDIRYEFRSEHLVKKS